MAGTLIRAGIVYIFIVGAIRLMGKRQIGDLQPSDLVVTILISEIATEPIVEENASLTESLLTITLLVLIEIAVSFICMKSQRLRKLIDGNEVMLIKEGNVQTKQLKKLRFTVDDLLCALRQKDVFNIEDVECAYIETNGTLSVLLKSSKQPVTSGQLSRPLPCGDMPLLLVSDGKVINENFDECKMTKKQFQNTLKAASLTLRDILIMTATPDGNCVIVEQNGKVKQRRKVD